MADIDVEKLKEKLYVVAKALFCIGETCVDVSKQHLSNEMALDKIRGYLNDANMWSRFQVDQLINGCVKPIVLNIPDEAQMEEFKEHLKRQGGLMLTDLDFPSIEITMPSCCDECPNNPNNGGSGNCSCALPYMQGSTIYESSCAANNQNGHVYEVNRNFLDNLQTNVHNHISETVKRTKRYIKEE